MRIAGVVWLNLAFLSWAAVASGQEMRAGEV